MSPASDAEKAAVIDKVAAFFTAFADKRPPFPELRGTLREDAFAVLSHVDGLIQVRLGELATRLEGLLEKLYAGDATSAAETLCPPGPEVWIHTSGDSGAGLAALWAGYDFRVDGKPTPSRGVNLFTLHRFEGKWSISAVADWQFPLGTPEQEIPEVLTEAPPEMMKPVHTFFEHLKHRNFDGVLSQVLPGSGATIARDSAPPMSLTVPELMAFLRDITGRYPPEVVIEERIFDVEARVCGNLGFLWTPFVVEADGELISRGVNVFTLLKRDGEWIISGLLDLGTRKL